MAISNLGVTIPQGIIFFFINSYALAVKTLPLDLQNTFTRVVKLVNYIQSSVTNTRAFQDLCNELRGTFDILLFHTEVRW